MKLNSIKPGILILGAAILASCGSSEKPAQMAAAPAAIPVSVYTVAEEDVTTVDTYPGVVVALNEVELRAEVGGYITGIFVKDGQKVTKGQKLYEIDRTNYLAAYNSAKANVQVAKANHDKSKKDAERYTNLAKQEAVAKQRVDYALTDLANAASQVAVAEAALATAKANLNRSVIVSPLTGTIGISQVKVGALASQGTTLLNTVSANDPIAVDIAVNQKDIPRFLKLQQNASTVKDSVFSIELQDKSVYKMAGKIVAVDRSVDPGTGTIKVRISYPNTSGMLLSGMTCNVKVLNKAESKQVTIPYKSVSEQLGEYMVYVVGDSSKAQQRIIKLGSETGEKIVVLNGLQAGEVIVSEGAQNVRPGSIVQAATKSPEVAATQPVKK
ncbi:Multidrug resistance protein MexA precursor [compost metagenome]|uniref:efflux RND transporter periplasmic adaptor subunit n=1 Tax=Pedobacter sp. ok626 TaxID=1761882 RepID=UPI00088A2B41|nr:efflux RND transporter periplasmic adaptor subunit [Pedobacter sp. ok626]SDL12595.1 membrane fusion protein, multidrug efflux system [Pedobacter sp. ok626]